MVLNTKLWVPNKYVWFGTQLWVPNLICGDWNKVVGSKKDLWGLEQSCGFRIRSFWFGTKLWVSNKICGAWNKVVGFLIRS